MSIDQLEAIFSASSADRTRLLSLCDELKHRRRPRAQRLAQLVEEALRSFQSADSESSLNVDEVTETIAANPDDALRDARRTRRIPITRRSTDGESSESFTVVQPMGTQPRPAAFRPALKTDLQLSVSDEDSRIERFCVALDELIEEMRRRGTGQQQFTLESGVQVLAEGQGFSYRFDFGEEANIFEGAQVDLIVGGRSRSGRLTGIVQGAIVVTLDEDFGETIETCILRLDNTALLQALHDRLAAIERGDTSGFQEDVANRVLHEEGHELGSIANITWPWAQSPTAEQQRFVEVALAHDLSWLWGPPGTGKTDTLSALIRLLFESGERSLICSNTNQAVDQLLLKLCRNMRANGDPALEQGRVLRLGRIEENLNQEFGEHIVPDRIVERRSSELTRRKHDVEADLERLGQAISSAQATIAKFEQVEIARRAVSAAESELHAATRLVHTLEAERMSASNRIAELRAELSAFQQAGTLRRFFMRSEHDIQADLTRQLGRRDDRVQRLQSAQANTAAATQALETCRSGLKDCEAAVLGQDRDQVIRGIAEYTARVIQLKAELSEIVAKLEDIRNAVLREARIVGATVTRTFLRPAEFASFDTVIVDEASMILLPAVFHAVGLATKRVVVAGDFQQLPPILQTEQEAIIREIGHDVFTEAGVADQSAFAGSHPRRVMLTQQFRMMPTLCGLVSDTFYQGALHTHEAANVPRFSEPNPLTSELTIIDTSRVYPFTTRNAFRSRLNLMHALAVRNLTLHLRDNGRLSDDEGKGRVGICSPYAAQAKLIQEILKSQKLGSAQVRVGTVHAFQGDERPLMVLDLVDSIGERNAGIFLQSNDLRDAGAKLFNVALSRARSGLIIVGNLTFLDRALPSDAILRGILCELQRLGQVIDVRDVLSLRPIWDDVRDFSPAVDLDAETLRTGLFRNRDFELQYSSDLRNAKRTIVIFSGFITPDRVARLADILRERIAAGVRVRCVTRPPKWNGTIPEKLGRDALEALESMGVAIDLRAEIHEKVVIIDERIVWFGSLNPLSHTHRTSELMARIDDSALARHLASILLLRRRSNDDLAKGCFADAENPRCEQCGGWSVLIKGRFGPFFRCCNGDDWKRNLDVRRKLSASAP